MKNIKLTHKIQKTDKYTGKMSSKEDWLYLLISTQQPTLLNIGCFWQYFSHNYSTTCKFDQKKRFFIFRCISSIINLSGTISVAVVIC